MDQKTKDEIIINIKDTIDQLTKATNTLQTILQELENEDSQPSSL
jgi:hypothetical protein